jgi:hypothetical protein
MGAGFTSQKALKSGETTGLYTKAQGHLASKIAQITTSGSSMIVRNKHMKPETFRNGAAGPNQAAPGNQQSGFEYYYFKTENSDEEKDEQANHVNVTHRELGKQVRTNNYFEANSVKLLPKQMIDKLRTTSKSPARLAELSETKTKFTEAASGGKKKDEIKSTQQTTARSTKSQYQGGVPLTNSGAKRVPDFKELLLESVRLKTTKGGM